VRTKEGNKEKDILSAAIKRFAEDGYFNAKISQIAEDAGVATGSVYVYYKNKEDLLNKIFINLWSELLEKLNVIRNDLGISPMNKMSMTIDSVFSVFSENPSLATVFVNEQNTVSNKGTKPFRTYYNRFLDIGESIVKEGINSGDFSDGINLKVFRHFIFGAIRNSLSFWAISHDKISLEIIREQSKFLLFKGIEKRH